MNFEINQLFKLRVINQSSLGNLKKTEQDVLSWTETQEIIKNLKLNEEEKIPVIVSVERLFSFACTDTNCQQVFGMCANDFLSSPEHKLHNLNFYVVKDKVPTTKDLIFYCSNCHKCDLYLNNKACYNVPENPHYEPICGPCKKCSQKDLCFGEKSVPAAYDNRYGPNIRVLNPEEDVVISQNTLKVLHGPKDRLDKFFAVPVNLVVKSPIATVVTNNATNER